MTNTTDIKITCLRNILPFFTAVEMIIFKLKKNIFLTFAQNIDGGRSIELPQTTANLLIYMLHAENEMAVGKSNFKQTKDHLAGFGRVWEHKFWNGFGLCYHLEYSFAIASGT